MAKFDVVQAWLDNVAYSHSNSENTSQSYQINLTDFYKFIDSTPQRTLAEYEGMSDRDFRRKYAQYLRGFISQLCREGYTSNTVKAKVTAVRSFFKYNDLPLGYVPLAKNKVTFHNRDITHEEIKTILASSGPRDIAFFCMMAQSGLRPVTLCKLKRKHVERDFAEGKKACRIDVPQEIAKGEYGTHWTFMGPASVKYLRRYLEAKRPGIGPEDYLFTSHGSGKQLNRKSMSGIFIRTIEKLKKSGKIEFEQEKTGKPRNVRLYNLRKFFNKYAGPAGEELKEFWMGHVGGVERHYTSKDVEWHRQQYIENTLPHLRLETATATETDKQIEELRNENKELRQRLNNVDQTIEAKIIQVLKKQKALIIIPQQHMEEAFTEIMGDKEKADEVLAKLKKIRKRQSQSES